MALQGKLHSQEHHRVQVGRFSILSDSASIERRRFVRYAILESEPVVFNWLFSSDDEEQGADEVRIYEIHVTNTQQGGSDRCVACLTTDDKETE